VIRALHASVSKAGVEVSTAFIQPVRYMRASASIRFPPHLIACIHSSWRCAGASGSCVVLSLQEGATWPSAHAYASQVFWSSAAAAQLAPQQTEQPAPPQEQQPQQQWPHKPTLQLQLFSWDGGPRPMPSGADLQQHNSRVKTLRVTVSDIRSRSPAHPGMVLGNVLYMDSFADVSRGWGWGVLAMVAAGCGVGGS
jgi:hypothetical protein